MRLVALVTAVWLGACGWSSHSAGGGDDDDDDDVTAPASVGDACMPSDVPEGGFRDPEVYIERDSDQCGGATCIVNHLLGDPRQEDPAEPDYVSPAMLDQRLHCTCKCGGEDPDSVDCLSCPAGFECCANFMIGPPDIRGSYCVSEGTCVTAE